MNETVEVVTSAELALQVWAVDETHRKLLLAIMLADLVDRHACRDGPSLPPIRLRDGTASLSANSPDTSIFKATVRFPRSRCRSRIERLAQIAAIRQIQRHQSRKQRRSMFVDRVRGKESLSFSYDANWLTRLDALTLDPDLQVYQSLQYPPSGTQGSFGVFLDSTPDRWGRMLMQRREAQRSKREGKP